MKTIKQEIDSLKERNNLSEYKEFKELYSFFSNNNYNLKKIDSKLALLTLSEKIIFLSDLKISKNTDFKNNYLEKRLKNYKETLKGTL